MNRCFLLRDSHNKTFFQIPTAIPETDFWNWRLVVFVSDPSSCNVCMLGITDSSHEDVPIWELLPGCSPDEQLCCGETNTLWYENIKLNPDVPKAEEKEVITMSPAKYSEWWQLNVVLLPSSRSNLQWSLLGQTQRNNWVSECSYREDELITKRHFGGLRGLDQQPTKQTNKRARKSLPNLFNLFEWDFSELIKECGLLHY